jgi:hypothetical protein
MNQDSEKEEDMPHTMVQSHGAVAPPHDEGEQVTSHLYVDNPSQEVEVGLELGITHMLTTHCHHLCKAV